MKKYLVILIGVMMSSCTRNEEHTLVTTQDEIVEMNWNYAVKDFYLMDAEEGETSAFEGSNEKVIFRSTHSLERNKKRPTPCVDLYIY